MRALILAGIVAQSPSRQLRLLSLARCAAPVHESGRLQRGNKPHMAEAYDLPKGELMKGKRGLILGVANHQSIAWGIASQLAAQGAELAFGYMEMNEKRVKPLGESLGVKAFATFDALQEGSTPALFDTVAK